MANRVYVAKIIARLKKVKIGSGVLGRFYYLNHSFLILCFQRCFEIGSTPGNFGIWNVPQVRRGIEDPRALA
jgi:hypothetical protein